MKNLDQELIKLGRLAIEYEELFYSTTSYGAKARAKRNEMFKIVQSIRIEYPELKSVDIN